MEIKLLNGDVCVPKILGGEGVITPKILGGGVSNPNNPPYLRHCSFTLYKLKVWTIWQIAHFHIHSKQRKVRTEDLQRTWISTEYLDQFPEYIYYFIYVL